VNDSNDPANNPCWDQVVDENAQRVFAIAMRILGSVHEAEDASQEAFVQALEFHKRNHVESWTGLLVRFATTRALDQLRRKKAHAPLRETDKVANPDPAQRMITHELRNQLLTTVVQLPDQQASVFWMIAIEQLSREEVSMALGISCEAVSTALYKARKTLAREMSGIQIGGKS
jgi:RNA polymerase sigma-70 factor (ECF subfamily)